MTRYLEMEEELNYSYEKEYGERNVVLENLAWKQKMGLLREREAILIIVSKIIFFIQYCTTISYKIKKD